MADSTIYVLDRNYLAITFLISLLIQSLAFLISYTLQFDKITDFSGGSNFFILALLTLLFGQNFEARNVIVSLAVLLWSIRLAGFLLLRVLKRGKDDRFDEMRSNFFRFGAFWVFQLFWVWVVSLPVTVLNSPNISSASEELSQVDFKLGSDWVGLIFWVLGFLIESLADLQKYRFKSDPNSKKDRLPVCRIGVWKISRHPNYFGEILLWWGIWLMAIGSARNPGIPESTRSLLYGTVISPIFITILLLFLSGLPTAEKPVQESIFIKSYKAKRSNSQDQQNGQGQPSNQSVNPQFGENAKNDDGGEGKAEGQVWKDYKDYLDQTSILLPIPQSIYRKIPTSIKSTVLLDWPIYRFDENSERAQHLINQINDEIN
ncbi:hypothetical protein BY996DRAFT_6430816 [Phakopsora pachyrhizi]|nr:hypothetical protein BY996DRAFT_6430816 [Phakopsora pachyrhizi]